MRIELTVAGASGSRDVALTAPGRTLLGELSLALGAVLGERPGTWWLGDRPLAGDLPLDAAGLRPGAVIATGRTTPVRPGVLALRVVAGPAAGTVLPLERGRLVVGRAPGCAVVLPDPDVSRRHAVLELSGTDIRLIDLDSTNGSRVDGVPVPAGGMVVAPGALIAVGDSVLTVAGPTQAPASVQPGDDGVLHVIRAPRQLAPIAADEIVLPSPPGPARVQPVHWLAALLPAAAAGLLAWLAGAPQFLLFALLSPLMMLGTALGDRRHWRRSHRREAATARQRRTAAEGRVAARLAAEAVTRRRTHPDPVAVLDEVTLPGCRLWERRSGDPDLLHVRLGVADLPAELRCRDGPTLRSAGTLPSVPLLADLRDGPLGIAGPPAMTAGVARWVLGQLTAHHAPADLELAVLVDETRAADWEWLRWVPHLRGRVAHCAAEWGGVVAELAELLEHRAASRCDTAGCWPGGWLVVLIDRANRLLDVSGLAAVLERGAAAGVSAVCVDADLTGLPASCAGLLTPSGETGTRMEFRVQRVGSRTEAVVDQVSREWADRLAREMAGLRLGGDGSSALPDSCGLLGVLGLDSAEATDIERMWARSRGTARAVLGRDTAGPLAVDLVADGPHALIAGTTGAGKSELLQTLVATLAANHPPDELNVLLIDYKGGAAFAECAALPHTAGLVTDLDPYLTERALRSLHSELRRREGLFAGAGVTDLAEYRTTGGEPVPRLIIVVDEFAALAAELPQFVHGLVGIAQRGRSLGVHLVLATQRPGRAVSAEIRANTALRIALRVTDAGESSDVIHTPDAALIERRLPGRGYLRVGQTLTAFQSAHAGQVTDHEDIAVEPLGSWRRRLPREPRAAAPSDLSRLVSAVTVAARRGGRGRASRSWLPALPTELATTALPASGCATSVCVGLVDLPDEQRQVPLTLDLRSGRSLLGVGSARSGRTSLLRLLATGAAEQLPPDGLHLHVLDAGGRLSTELRRLPHAATVLGPAEYELAARLLHRLADECARRAAHAGTADPLLLLLIDGWDTLTAGLSDVDALRCTELLANLLRIGPATGVTIAVTGDRGLLVPRFAGGFTDRLLFRLAEPTDYALAGLDRRAVPSDMPPGRVVRTPDGAAAQLALPPDLAPAVERWPVTCGVRRPALRIRPLPTQLRRTDLVALPGRLLLGVAGDEGHTLAVDPFAGAGRLLVAGPARSGRTTTLCLLAEQAADVEWSVIAAVGARSRLRDIAMARGLRTVSPSDSTGPGPPPTGRTLLLVDDSEAFADTPTGDRLLDWLRTCGPELAAVVAARSDQLATAYRGLGVEVRHSQRGILLRPGPLDGELLGAQLARRVSSGPPGRGVAVGDAGWWGDELPAGEPRPVQVALP